MKRSYHQTAHRCTITVLIILFTTVNHGHGSDSFPGARKFGRERAPVFFLDFYQRHLSHLRGSRCPMYPSCSEYAREVIGHYSPVQAYPLIGDRLLRCGHDFATYTDTIIGQHRRWLDPPFPQTMESVVTDSSSMCGRTDGASGGNAADFLYRSGFYEQAYFEYVRDLSYAQDPAMVLKAAFAAYGAYDYKRFTRELTRLVTLLPDTPHGPRGELYLLAAKRGYTEGLHTTAYAVLEKYRPFFTTPVLHEEYRLLAKVTALYCGIDTVAKLTKDDFTTGSPLVGYLGRIDSLDRSLTALRPRSAIAAGVLSAIVPGAGYMVGERKRTALFALLFNGLLAWSTVEFVQQKNYGAATFSAMLGSGFYIGAVVGSVRAVDFYNKRKRAELIAGSLHDLDVDP